MCFTMSKSHLLALLIFTACMEKKSLLLFHFPVNDWFTKQQAIAVAILDFRLQNMLR